MDLDIFISYSHHDDATHGNWVQRFHDQLAADFRSRSGKKLAIFLDREGLNAGNVLSGRLQDALNRSAIFIPILSPAYLSSDWCRREFLHFLRQAGERVLVGSSSRIVPVQLMPYDRYEPDAAADRPDVQQIRGFLSDNEILYADFYKHPLPIPPEDTAFKERIAELSDDIYALLKTILASPGPLPDPEANGPAIFLGYAAGRAKTLRESLLKELLQQRKYGKIAHRILPDEAPDAPADPKTLPAGQLEAFLRRQLVAADFSIHLFDDLEGPKTADTREPVAHVQYRLACETAAARPGFRVFTAQSVTDDCATLQEQFLQRVEQDAKTNPQVQFLPDFELKAVKDFLLETIQLDAQKTPELPDRPAETAPRRVFFIHDHRDKDDPLRNRLDDLIWSQQYDVYVPVFREDDPHIDPDSSFRDFWLVCNKAVVLLRNASTAWCNAVKVELIKTATEKRPPYAMAICVTDPDAARRIREVRSHEFQVIDCAQEGFEQHVIQFLNAQRHA